jgi:uncharacterized protein YcbK (DUF882 family)
MRWENYPNFTEKELACTFTGKCFMMEHFMEKLQELRIAYGKPLIITSGFRDPKHPVEQAKKRPGVHTRGIAVDIACDGQEAYKIVRLAINLGFKGIGIKQKASGRFIHLDTFDQDPRPNIWSY